MANGIYNRYNYHSMRGELALQTNTIRCLLLRSTGTYAFNPDHDFVADLFTNGGVELSVASYARQTVASPAVSGVDADDEAQFTASNLSFGALEVGQTVSAVIFYKFVTDDSDSVLLSYHDGKAEVRCAAPVDAPLSGAITAITQANPAVVTSTAHGLTNGDKVKITGVNGMTEVNNNVYTVTATTDDTFSLDGVNSSAYTAYASGGTWKEVKKVYLADLHDSLLDGASVDFDGSSGLLYGSPVEGDAYIEVADLSGAIAAQATAEIQTTVALPAILGGGTFQVTIPANGLYRGLGGSY